LKRFLIPLLATLTLPISLIAEIDREIHNLCLPAKDYAGCIKLQTENKNTHLKKSESSENELIKSKWTYFDYEDAASGKTAFKASLTSENKINLSFPYGGNQHGTLSIRNHPRFGSDIFFSILKGQILSIDGYSYDNKYFLVRFDDGKVERWKYLEAADQSSDIIFISNEKIFKERLTNSRTIYLTVNLYQDGQRTFIFDVKGLKKEFK
tara:strand:+ start:66 stop:692 length:627 start_codon:yes stop_codon:yes gene_type:complete